MIADGFLKVENKEPLFSFSIWVSPLYLTENNIQTHMVNRDKTTWLCINICTHTCMCVCVAITVYNCLFFAYVSVLITHGDQRYQCLNERLNNKEQCYCTRVLRFWDHVRASEAFVCLFFFFVFFYSCPCGDQR